GRPDRAESRVLHLRAGTALGRPREAVLLPGPAPGGRAAGAARGRLRPPGQQPRPRLRLRRTGRHPGAPGRRRHRRGRGRSGPGAGGAPGPPRPRRAGGVGAADAEVVLGTPQGGPNMPSEPVGHVRRAAAALVGAGATLVAGHSAHVPHGVAGPVLYDLGDFLDDSRVDPRLRNDLGLLLLVTLDGRGPV